MRPRRNAPGASVSFPPLLTASATGINVQFQFSAPAATAFHIDNVELDPYLRREAAGRGRGSPYGAML